MRKVFEHIFIFLDNYLACKSIRCNRVFNIQQIYLTSEKAINIFCTVSIRYQAFLLDFTKHVKNFIHVVNTRKDKCIIMIHIKIHIYVHALEKLSF